MIFVDVLKWLYIGTIILNIEKKMLLYLVQHPLQFIHYTIDKKWFIESIILLITHLFIYLIIL